jgi:hypothetical protein
MPDMTQRLLIAPIDQYNNRFDVFIETPSGNLEHAQLYRSNGTFKDVIPKWEALERPERQRPLRQFHTTLKVVAP